MLNKTTHEFHNGLHIEMEATDNGLAITISGGAAYLVTNHDRSAGGDTVVYVKPGGPIQPPAAARPDVPESFRAALTPEGLAEIRERNRANGRSVLRRRLGL